MFMELVSVVQGWFVELLSLTPNFYLSLFIFTALTKVVLFPLSLWSHANSLKMVSIMPEINGLKMKYFGDSDQICEESARLFKQKHYHPLLSLLPLAIQILILLWLIRVINGMAQSNPDRLFAQIPLKHGGWLWLVPLAAGFSSWIFGEVQDRIHPLQREQSVLQRASVNWTSIMISLLLGGTVPFAVAYYWICSNILSIPVQFLCNFCMKPEKYINYKALYRSKILLAKLEKSCKITISKEDKLREKKDFKRFFSIANKKLVFHSEASGFYKYYQALIEWLLENSNVVIHYVTNDPKDQVFKLAEKYPKLKPYYIGPRKIIPLMMKMDADIVVMTTPDLNRFHIKRSYVRNDIEYIYLHHSLTSLTMCTREHAYDHYDTIFAAGPHQSEEIRAMEKEYKTAEKKLVPFGYAFLDTLIEKFRSSENKKDGKTQILIAPSYQDGNILDSVLDTVLEKLSGKGYRIIVRPHPQYIRRFPANWANIQKRFADTKGEDLTFQSDFSSNSTIYNSDLLITDWSGIAYEFAFVTGCPALFINTPMKVINPNYKKFGIPTDISFREKVGVVLEPEDADKIGDEVAGMLAQSGRYRQQIEALMHENLYNIGETGKTGGKYIISQLIQRQKQNKSEK